MMNDYQLHWILDAAAIYPVPLDWILPRVKTQHLNALRIPSYVMKDYAMLVYFVLEEGLMQLWCGPELLDLAGARLALGERVQGLHVVEDALPEIRLTTEGGARWEQMARPQWDRFFYYSMLLPNETMRVSGILASMNRDALIAYLGWFDRLESVDINWDTLRIETHSGYAVTYWKRLNGVHEARLDGLYHLPERRVPTVASDWMVSLGNWRLRPWDRPDWPE